MGDDYDLERLTADVTKSKKRIQELEAQVVTLNAEIKKEKDTYFELLQKVQRKIQDQLLEAKQSQNGNTAENTAQRKLESVPTQGAAPNSNKDIRHVADPPSTSSNGKGEESSPVENPPKKQRTEQPSPADVFVIDDNSQSSEQDTIVESAKKANDKSSDARDGSNTESKSPNSKEKAIRSEGPKKQQQDDNNSMNVGMEGKDVAKSLLMLQHNKHTSDIGKSATSVPPPPPSFRSKMDEVKSATSDGVHDSAEASRTRKKDRRFSPIQLDVLRFIEERLPDIQAIFKEQKKRETDILVCPQATQGNYYVRNEDKQRYSLPPGIQGTQPRFGKQNFNALLHNVMLSGKKLKLDSNYVNFEDPRDCGEVIDKLSKVFTAFMKEGNGEAVPHPQRFRQSTASSSSNALADED